MSGKSNKPELSAILATRRNFEPIRKTISHLRAQSAHEKIELVIVCPKASELNADAGAFDGLWGHRVIEVGPIDSVARANAAGAKAACGPVVVFCEDHSFPQANWAQSLIDAHQSDWAAVGPTLFNANPKTSLSRADFLLGYGIWAEPIPAGEMEHLPGHNSAYKRDLLLSYGDRLNAMLEAESVLQWDMRQHGHRLYMQPTARVAHTNFSRFKPWAIIQFHCGRIFAATRSANWPIWKRIVYFLGSPLIPLVRFKRLMQYSRRIATSQQLGVGGVLALIWALIFDGAGQMLGYAIGAGNSLDNAHEFDRLNTHITEADRRELEAALP